MKRDGHSQPWQLPGAITFDSCTTQQIHSQLIKGSRCEAIQIHVWARCAVTGQCFRESFMFCYPFSSDPRFQCWAHSVSEAPLALPEATVRLAFSPFGRDGGVVPLNALLVTSAALALSFALSEKGFAVF
jgi:hypothetical protein